MALVAPGVARFTYNGDFGGPGSAWANVIDIDMLGDVSIDRAEMCLLMAGVLGKAWVDHIAENVVSSVTLRDVSWVDLDSATGSTGSTTDFVDVDAPQSGTNVGDMLARNTCYLIKKGGGSQRGARSGRWYVPGINEEEAGEVNISAERVTQFNADLLFYLGQITDPVFDPAFSAQPVVVHTRNTGTPSAPNIIYTGKTPITTMTCDPIMATQRRRLRS